MNDYPYIGIWGRICDSYSYYIEEQRRRAKADKAPHNAIYRLETGEWATTGDVNNANTRMQISLECQHLGILDPYTSTVTQGGQ